MCSLRVRAGKTHSDAYVSHALERTHGPVQPGVLAGHSDFATTRSYVHPNLETGREAMERTRGAQGRPNSGHTGGNVAVPSEAEEVGNVMPNKDLKWYARGDSNTRPLAPEASALSS